MLFKLFVLALGLCAHVTQGFEDKTVAQYLVDSGYSTLVSLLRKANLFDTLNSNGPFTMFAPTDAAFAKLPAAILQKLSNNPALLTNVLKQHVLSGFVLAPMISNNTSKDALNGQPLAFTMFTNRTILVNGIRIGKTDMIVNNGVVHSIDSVIYEDQKNMAETLLSKNDQFATLNLLLTITDLEPALMSGQLTLFAPTDSAFTAIGNALPDFSSPNAVATYTEILKNHVVNGTYHASDLTDGMQLTTLHGTKVTVHLGSGVMIDNAQVTEADLNATNGVIHVINGVLVPSDL